MQVAGKRGDSVYYLKKLVPYILDLFNGEIYGDVRIYHRNLGNARLGGLYFPNTREIHLNSTRKAFLGKVETLLHECVHANQHFRGDLRVEDGDFIYKNVLYSAEYISANYQSVPFEEEAFSKQGELYCKLMHNLITKDSDLAKNILRYNLKTLSGK